MGRRSATAMCLLGALLCAMLGTGDVGGAEASLVHGGTRGGGLFSRYRSSSTSSYFRSLRRLASVAVGRNLALFTLWPTSGAPPFAALAASHLRVDPSTGLIVELPESEIAEDVVAFHTPVQHPGGQRPGSQEENNKILYPGQWHSWTSLGPDRAVGGFPARQRRGRKTKVDNTPSSPDNDTDGKYNAGDDANGLHYGGGGAGLPVMGSGAPHATYSAPSPSPSSADDSRASSGTPSSGLANGGANGLPSVGLSAGPAAPTASASATTHPSTPGGKRYHPEPALAVLFDRYGGVDAALQVLTSSTAKNANDPVMWSDLGNAYRVKGDSDRAIECFESALRLQPHPDFFLNLGGVRFVLGEVDEAVRLFTLGLQMNPRHVLLQFSMGNAYAMLGRKEEAARSFEATLRIQPDFTAAEQYLRTLRRERKQQRWPNWSTVAAAALLIVACAAVQRVVQYYALGGAATAAAVTRGGGGGGYNDGCHDGYDDGKADRRYPSGAGGVLGMFGVSGGGSRHGNEWNAAGPQAGGQPGGGMKQRRKGRHH